MTGGDGRAILIHAMQAVMRDGRTMKALPVLDTLYGNPVDVVRRLTDGGLNVTYAGRINEWQYAIDLHPRKRDGDGDGDGD